MAVYSSACVLSLLSSFRSSSFLGPSRWYRSYGSSCGSLFLFCFLSLHVCVCVCALALAPPWLNSNNNKENDQFLLLRSAYPFCDQTPIRACPTSGPVTGPLAWCEAVAETRRGNAPSQSSGYGLCPISSHILPRRPTHNRSRYAGRHVAHPPWGGPGVPLQ